MQGTKRRVGRKGGRVNLVENDYIIFNRLIRSTHTALFMMLIYIHNVFIHMLVQ